ncbi:MAG: CPBP family intramembrane glutamic endopeptidase [Pseudomonadota bacterium]
MVESPARQIETRVRQGLSWHRLRHRPFVRYIAPAHRPKRGPWLALVVVVVIQVISLAIAYRVAEEYFPQLFFDGGPGALRETNAEFLLFNLAVISGELLLFAVFVPLFHRRSFWSLFGPSPLFWRGMAACLVPVALTFVASYVYELIDPIGPEWPQYQEPIADAAIYMGTAAILIVFQATSEEVMFRGYLVQQIAVRWSSPFFWAILPSVAFGLLHFGDGTDPERAWGAAITAGLTGLAFAYTTWRTGSLGFAVGYHIINNWLAILVFGEAGDEFAAMGLWLYPPLSGTEMVIWSAFFSALMMLSLEIPPVRRWLRLPPLWGRRQSISQ